MCIRKRGFTLVEVLVVIGIIAVLAALLLPALTAARRQANLVVCQSNLRQMTAAAVMHAQEHQGYMPLAGELVALTGQYGPNAVAEGLNDPYMRRYTYTRIMAPGNALDRVLSIPPLPAALAPYFGIRDLPFNDWNTMDAVLNDNRIRRHFLCPATGAHEKNRANNNPGDSTLVGQGTMMSVCEVGGAMIACWSSNSDYGFNEGLLGYHIDPKYSSRRLAGKVSKQRNSAQLVLFSDANPRSTPANRYIPDGWICWTPSLTDTDSPTLANVFKDDGKAVHRDSFDERRHRGRINVAFADGHVQTLKINAADLEHAYLLPP